MITLRIFQNCNTTTVYLHSIHSKIDIPIDTLLHYADTIKFSANSASNDYMQRVFD